MRLIGSIVATALWLLKRWLTRRDAREPQRRVDEGRAAAAQGDDEKLNALIDAARDERLRRK